MKVIVSAISGNLGQAITKTIRKYYDNVTIIGIDAINPLQGYGLCDKLIKVPFAKDVNFIDSIIEIVTQFNINLIVPCNDYEVEAFMANEYLNQITLATKYKSKVNLLDKYLCYTEFKKFGIEFCNSVLPSNYKFEFENVIVKPRRGSGSKGIIINPSNFLKFEDNFLIQEYIDGIELTIPFYANLNNQLVGFLPLIKYGNAPNNSYQTYNKERNVEIRVILLKIIKNFHLKGPCNLQCIINGNGIYPFELNFRYSGSVDIQDVLGFNILKIGLDEFVTGQAYTGGMCLRKGFAIRQYQSEVFLTDEDQLDGKYFVNE